MVIIIFYNYWRKQIVITMLPVKYPPLFYLKISIEIYSLIGVCSAAAVGGGLGGRGGVSTSGALAYISAPS